MTSALWLLMKLRLKGWGRRMARNVQTVKGALLTAFFSLMLMMWLGSMILNAFILPRPPGSGIPPEHVERFGPLALLAYCLAIVVFSGSQLPLTYTPAEV